jgi:hypothetical protein
MAQEPVDYEAVLTDLQSKRDSLDTAIAAIRAVLTSGAHVAVGGGSGAAGRTFDPASIPDDAFFGLSIVEGAKKFLTMVRRKQSVKELADALDRGGLPHSSTNFVATVATMLNRADDPDLVRVGRGEWGLAPWYGNRRPKVEPVKRTKKKRAQRKAKADAAKPKPKEAAAPATKAAPTPKSKPKAATDAQMREANES